MPSIFSSTAPLLTAEEAQRKTEYIQTELLRVQRACEYRAAHPYDPAEAQGDADKNNFNSCSGPLGTKARSGDGTSPPVSKLSDTSEPSMKFGRSFSSSHLYSNTTGSYRSNGEGDSFLKASSVLSKSLAASGRIQGGSGGGSGGRSVLSFSEFERRRITQLLGRVAVEIAAVWAYVHQCSALGDETGSVGAYTTVTPSYTATKTARGPTRQSSESSTAATTPTSERGFSQLRLHQAPPSQQQAASVVGAVRSGGGLEAVNKGNDNMRWEAASTLNTLINTVISVQQMLARSREEGSDNANTNSSSVNANRTFVAGQDRTFLAATVRSDSAVPSTPPTQRGGNSVAVSPAASVAKVVRTLPASAIVPSLPSSVLSQHPAETSNISAVHSPDSSSQKLDGPETPSAVPAAATATTKAGAGMTAVPAYLRKYVWEESENTATEGEGDEKEKTDEEVDIDNIEDVDDDATVVVNIDRGDSRSVSAGSATGANLRSFSRVSDALATSHGDSHHTSPSSGPSRTEVHLGNTVGNGNNNNDNTTSNSNMRLQGNVSRIISHHRFDSDMGFNTPSSPFKRVISGSSLRSSSLVGSPVQTQHYSHPRSHGYSTSSLYSQPLNPNGGTHQTNTNDNTTNSRSHNNNSSGGRSPDSADMSVAAAAAYSRSTSLLRRPHRLEVPISRTQSLRRVPSYASLTSATSSGSPPNGAVPTTSATCSAVTCHARVPSFQAGKMNCGNETNNASGCGFGGGGGVLCTTAGGSVLTSSPPVALSTCATVDSPHSSIAGLHFKRVFSVDSENGGWLPGSLTDSLEMSHSKAASLFGRPIVPASYSINVSPSPAPQDVRGTSVADWQGDPIPVTAPTKSTMLGASPSVTAAAGGGDAGGASIASSALTASYFVPGRADSFRGGGGGGGSVHSRNLTPYYFPSPSGLSVRVSVPPPAAPPRPTASQNNGGWAPTTAIIRPNVHSARTTANGLPGSMTQNQPTSTSVFATGLVKTLEAAPLPPHSYRINTEKLANFLRCVRAMVQTEFSEEEFDSMHLFYFLPGVSLVKTASAQESGKEESEGRSGTTSAAHNAESEDVPLPLFSGGERAPVRLANLDVFYSWVKRKVQEVCDNVGIPAEPYLSLL